MKHLRMSRTRYSDKEKVRILRDFEQHGQSAAAFCRQRGVSYQTLMNWRCRTEANLPPPEQPPAFLEFELGAPHQRPALVGPLVELKLGGGIILRIHPSGRVTGNSTTSGSPSGSFTGTQRDAAGRMTGSSSGTGKCQGVAKVPVPQRPAK